MDNKYLCSILGITRADIAKFAGITRQAVAQGSCSVDLAALALIEAARFDQEKMCRARQALRGLEGFLSGGV